MQEYFAAATVFQSAIENRQLAEPHPRFAIRSSHVGEEPRLHRRRCINAGARHRGKHCHLQRGQRCPVAPRWHYRSRTLVRHPREIRQTELEEHRHLPARFPGNSKEPPGLLLRRGRKRRQRQLFGRRRTAPAQPGEGHVAMVRRFRRAAAHGTPLPRRGRPASRQSSCDLGLRDLARALRTRPFHSRQEHSIKSRGLPRRWCDGTGLRLASTNSTLDSAGPGRQ